MYGLIFLFKWKAEPVQRKTVETDNGLFFAQQVGLLLLAWYFEILTRRSQSPQIMNNACAAPTVLLR